jgi:hypothetical protein
MIRRTALALVAIAGAFAGGAAQAQNTTDADLKCMVVAGALNHSTDPQTRTASSLMVFYFLGRLDARDANMDIATALKGQMQAMKATDLQAEAKRCGDIMTGRSQALQAVSAKLAASAPPPAGGAPAAATPAPKAAPAAKPAAKKK